jgi:very-short-patch-repair endonuclease
MATVKIYGREPGWRECHNKERRDRQFKKAVAILAQQKNRELYTAPLARIQRIVYDANSFGSATEIILAAEILRRGLSIWLQYPLDGHRFDMCIADEPLLIEVDGLHHDPPERRKADIEQAVNARLRGYNLVRLTDWEVEGNVVEAGDKVEEAFAFGTSIHRDAELVEMKAVNRIDKEIKSRAKAVLMPWDMMTDVDNGLQHILGDKQPRREIRPKSQTQIIREAEQLKKKAIWSA